MTIPRRESGEVRLQLRAVSGAPDGRGWQVAVVRGTAHDPAREPWQTVADLDQSSTVRRLAALALGPAVDLDGFIERAVLPAGVLLIVPNRRWRR